MKISLSVKTPPYPCGYLPDHEATLEQSVAIQLNHQEYRNLLDGRWRRFGRGLFRPVCQSCEKCIPIRIPVDRFQPNRSQKRNARSNREILKLRVETVSTSEEQMETVGQLHYLFHGMQEKQKQWPEVYPWDSAQFARNMTDQPFDVELWTYLLDGRVVGAGYVDPLPDGLSAIYFVYHPDIREFAPGIWNVLAMIEGAKARGLKYVFLGYWVKGSDSMTYKAAFQPAEILGPEGEWIPFPQFYPC